MASLIWSEQAGDDVNEIADYIARESSHYAMQTVRKLVEAVESMSEHPMVGRVVPELNEPVIREIIVGNYRIIYSIRKSDTVEIITVHHSARLLKVDLLQKYLYE